MPYTYIMYCAGVWGKTYVTNIKCLVLLQKKVIRLLCVAKRLDHTNLLFTMYIFLNYQISSSYKLL